MGARIGIDLGTTNSAAAMVYDDGPHVIPRGDGVLIPSVVRFRWEDGPEDVEVGKDADHSGHQRVVRSVKRLMGRTYDTAMAEGAAEYFTSREVVLERRHRQDLVLAIRGSSDETKDFWPHQVSARILEAVRRHAESHLETSIEKVALTVPAYFEDSHRAATLEAAKLAGLDVWEPLLDEPTAAALAFDRSVGLPPGEPLLVVDWGGGTFDVTLLMNDGSEWVQMGIDGYLTLGGDDVDLALAGMVLDMKSLPLELLKDDAARWTLLRTAQGAKHRLSENEKASFFCTVYHPETGAKIPVAAGIERKAFENVVESLVTRGLDCVQACIEKAHVPMEEVKKILLVGGSSRIPLLRERLGALLPAAHFHDEVDPMMAVALGAALYAQMERPEVRPVCPYGYAVQVDGKLQVVISPNLEIPIHPPIRIEPAPRTGYEDQTVYRLKLFRFSSRERHLKDVSESRCACIYGRNLTPAPAGSELEIDVWLDENKVLQARVGHARRGASTRVEPSLSEIGSEALFARLLDRTLEGEALLEANRDNRAPLFEEIRETLESARSALSGKDRESAEKCSEMLEDGIEQATRDRSQSSAAEVILGWMYFYHHDLLPEFWYLFNDEKQAEILKRMRAIHILVEEKSSDEELWRGFHRLNETLMEGETGRIIKAYRQANTLGVSQRLGRELGKLSQRAAFHLSRGEMTPYHGVKRELESKMEQAEASVRGWYEAGEIRVVRPDLEMRKAATS